MLSELQIFSVGIIVGTVVTVSSIFAYTKISSTDQHNHYLQKAASALE